MSMLDSFFNKGFKAAKCKTLLKLTIPRIKLLRNRREIQIKQMRRDIAKLLETGQEATARIRVEHIIREENVMAAQEILELFCELIAVRLPIIETQRECPLDLKEAISSVCFAAPRCADLQELLQVQMLFVSKYGKEFVSAATELRPDCGVNRQLIELLSVRAPSPETKLKLLKEIAEEPELEWDPASTETEFFKPHEDLLNGPTQFVSGSKLPLPAEKHDETLNSAGGHIQNEQPDSDTDFDPLDFPEVPKVSLWSSANAASAPVISPPSPATPDPETERGSSRHSGASGYVLPMSPLEPNTLMQEDLVTKENETPNDPAGAKENKQFLPFISPPSVSSASISARPSDSPPAIWRTKSEANVDLQDVLAAAQAAAETAERAAAAARSAASLAQVRIAELTQKKNDQVTVNSSSENPFHTDIPHQPASTEKPNFDHQSSSSDLDDVLYSPDSHQVHQEQEHQGSEVADLPSVNILKVGFDSPVSSDHALEQDHLQHEPQRLTSMDDEYFSYPNLFSSQNSILGSDGSFKYNSHTHSHY
ncbi:IST1 homolog [Durio zibethinus]|uniref:IST1 homolog n=1 Tax=Durio zibethinus TaxID=66656 RepID=A0A6P6B8W8_DURZI|nr:IST1 homolog [Durio zibethinus]